MPATTPDNVSVEAESTVALPVRVIALSMIVVEVTASVPPASVRAPPPRLASLATASVPALTVVVPL